MKSPGNGNKRFVKKIEFKEKQKLKGKRRLNNGLLWGLGMFGLIGWSIVVPTLLGTFLGVWIDDNYPSKHSWTLTFLLTGLIVGCLGAWVWLSKEKKDINKDEEDANV